MKAFETKDYKAFTMFENRWLLLRLECLMILIHVRLVGAVWATYGALMVAIYPR